MKYTMEECFKKVGIMMDNSSWIYNVKKGDIPKEGDNVKVNIKDLARIIAYTLRLEERIKKLERKVK